MINDLDFLNNKSPCVLTFKGLTFPSAENAFQSTRFSDFKTKQKFTVFAPFEAEYKGHQFKTTEPDWDNKKYDLMYEVLKTKFSDPILKQLLLDTGDNIIVITNKNHEHEWGVCTCYKCKHTGANKAGQLLMLLRDELRNKEV